MMTPDHSIESTFSMSIAASSLINLIAIVTSAKFGSNDSATLSYTLDDYSEMYDVRRARIFGQRSTVESNADQMSWIDHQNRFAPISAHESIASLIAVELDM